MHKTPVKQNLDQTSDICIVCRKTVPQKRIYRIDGSTLKRKALQDLMLKYGGVNVNSGLMCQGCNEKLQTLHKKCNEFYELCQNNIMKAQPKRMASSPAGSPITKSLQSFPKKKSKTSVKLFEAETTNETTVNTVTTRITTEHDSMDFEITECNTNDVTKVTEHAVLTPSKIPRPVHFHGYSAAARKSTASKTAETAKLTPELVFHPSDLDHDYQNSRKSSRNAYNPDLIEINKFLKLYNCCNENSISANEMQSLYSICSGGSLDQLSTWIINNDTVRKSVVEKMIVQNKHTISNMGNKKYGFVSCLMKKDVKELKCSRWVDIISEFKCLFPDLFALLMFILIDDKKIGLYTNLQNLIPRLGLIYGILMQTRNSSLSKVQRIMSLLLIDNICDQKVFDRLQRMGVCLSYNRSIRLQAIIGGSFNNQLIDFVRDHRRFRIVGDNINWSVGVDDQRMDRRGHMDHAFGSLVVIQNVNFDHLPNIVPQVPYWESNFNSYVPSATDMTEIRNDYTVLIARVAFQHIPYFKRFETVVPRYISKPCSETLRSKNVVIPLPVLFENEQKYSDVVKILDSYEEIVSDVYAKAGRNTEKVHIGGDQLTRERFSGAKCLRSHHQNPVEKFEHLSPITFEFFHMNMNFLSVIFKELYNEGSGASLGTLKSLQDRISRTNVKAEVKAAYNQDRDFFISVTDAYIVECLLTHFGMDDVLSMPTKHIPPDFDTEDEKLKWFYQAIGNMIKTYVFSREDGPLTDVQNVQVEGVIKNMTLANGRTVQLFIRKMPCSSVSPDRVRSYSQQILEFGLLFKNLLDLECMPERIRGIRILKLLMLYFKSHKNLSKYAYEILRLLVHQLSLLSERKANEEFYGLFVNTRGQFNTHIPADLRMEFHVKEVKKHIGHMSSNKTQANISNRTRAISSIKEVADNFDTESAVVKRSKKHSVVSAFQDEVSMIEDLRKVRPFVETPGRVHLCFLNIQRSISENLNVEHYRQWIEDRIIRFSNELGN